MWYWYETLVLYIVSLLAQTLGMIDPSREACLNHARPACECVVFQSYGLSKGHFHSPDFPNFYQHGIDCILYTFIGDFNEIVEIKFLNMDLEAKQDTMYSQNNGCRDYVRIFKNLDRPEVNENSHHDDELCGRIDDLEEKRYYSSDRALILEFHTNRDSKENHSGFKGVFTFKDKTAYKTDGLLQYGTQCTWDIQRGNNHTTGQFFSPRYPQKYPPNSNCQYTFMGKDSERVKVIFNLIQLPNEHSSCENHGDIIRVFDGRDRFSPLIEEFCATHNMVQRISTGPYMYIEFRSDRRREKRGFNAEYQFIADTDSVIFPSRDGVPENPLISYEPGALQCNNTYYAQKQASGTIQSPNYPEVYPQGIECQYEFFADGQQRVQLNVTKMNLYYSAGDPTDPYNCMNEDRIIVIVYIGKEEEKLGEFCGQKAPPLLMSNGHRMKVVFKSLKSGKRDDSGFTINYSFRTDFGVQGNGIQDQREICTFNFRSTKNMNGYFTSPNYGGQYPRLTECRYLFYGRKNEQVEVDFLEFDVNGIIPRCDQANNDKSDYVAFSNFLNVEDRKIPRYCGSRLTYDTQRSDAAFFRVIFKSNEKFDADGFKARYTFVTVEDPDEKTTSTPKAYGSANKASSSVRCTLIYIVTLFVIFESVISQYVDSV